MCSLCCDAIDLFSMSLKTADSFASHYYDEGQACLSSFQVQFVRSLELSSGVEFSHLVSVGSRVVGQPFA
jgi:hypothetical protein